MEGGVLDIVKVLKEVIQSKDIRWYNGGIQEEGWRTLDVGFYNWQSYWIHFKVDYDYGSYPNSDYVITSVNLSPKFWLEEILQSVKKAVSIDEKGNYYLSEEENEQERKSAYGEIFSMKSSFMVSYETYEIMRDEFKKIDKYKYVADIMEKHIKEVLDPALEKMERIYNIFDENREATYKTKSYR